jgi:hypothetical protein
MATWSHLAKRFFGSLSSRPPTEDDEVWARSHLLDGEEALWDRMGGADRRHAVGVARLAVADLGEEVAGRPVVAAALLHDVGKVEAGAGPWRRAAYTLLAKAAGRSRCAGWHDRSGPAGRVGRYLSHDTLGADLLVSAGSDELTASWAREHHLPPDRWTVPALVGEALKAADDD